MGERYFQSGRIMPKPIYIDVCALSRPFDEQNYLRIRLETEAMNLILLKVREGKYKLLFSAVHIKEIEAISDVIERVELQMILDRLGEPIKADLAATRSRAEKLVRLGFGIADAAHVAFAEQLGAQLITCDDRLVKKCLVHKVKCPTAELRGI
jgi:predicted nucleic acid-binding protein